jgi:hypothetical protein
MPGFDRCDPGRGTGPPRYPGTFMLAFREAVAGMGWKISRWLGDAVECVDDQRREQIVRLENLYRRARQENRSTWPELIADFLRSVPREHLDNPPANLAEVADRLLVRLGPPIPKQGNIEIWSRPLVQPYLAISLVIDYPQSMSYVTVQMMEESGRHEDEWVDRAMANLDARTPAECIQVVDPGSGLRHCAVGDAYDSSRALILDKIVSDLPEDGCFVAIPGRDQLLVLPVTAEGLTHVALLKNVAEKFHKSAPYSISDQVFWVRGREWFHFPIELGEDNARVQPPAEFIKILERLAPEEGEQGSAES